MSKKGEKLQILIFMRKIYKYIIKLRQKISEIENKIEEIRNEILSSYE